MEITVKEFPSVELISINGRVDSVEAPRLVQVLEAANLRGNYKLVVDMSRLEYMSSAGFRALRNAQVNSKRQDRGEVVLSQVPELVRQALELVGLSEFFTIIDPVSAALDYAENLSAGVSSADAQPASPEM